MRAAFYGKDAAFDGRFLAGVLTTGIYCLPSCGARKPKPENIRFFADEAAARAAGLRPCKRCRPDAFYRGEDPDLDALVELTASMREDPAAFDGVAAMAARAGMGATKLTELFRRHLQTTPAASLTRARVETACRHLAAGRPITEAGFAVGYESASAFHDAFRRATRMTPGAYRLFVLGGNGRAGNGGSRRPPAAGFGPVERSFTLDLPARFTAAPTWAVLGRDPTGVTERVEGASAAKALLTRDGPVLLRMDLGRGRARCEARASGPLSPPAAAEVHRAALGLLGLHLEPAAFERSVLARPWLAPLVSGRRGLRMPRFPSVLESFVWAVIGQQVNLAFAAALRSDLIALAGTPALDGFRAHPDAAALAALDYEDLTRLRYSRRKAEYVIDGARLVASGELDLEALSDYPASSAEATLRGVRGIGPWSAQYVLMRGCGLPDCVPVGDAGLTEALRRFFDLEERPDAGRTRELMEPFAPHRSLATMHLWMSLGEAP